MHFEWTQITDTPSLECDSNVGLRGCRGLVSDRSSIYFGKFGKTQGEAEVWRHDSRGNVRLFRASDYNSILNSIGEMVFFRGMLVVAAGVQGDVAGMACLDHIQTDRQ